MRTKARVWFALALLVAAAPVLSACYTTQGAGEDLSAAGKDISGTSQKHTNYTP
jgi:predicted small secreted protein